MRVGRVVVLVQYVGIFKFFSRNPDVGLRSISFPADEILVASPACSHIQDTVYFPFLGAVLSDNWSRALQFPGRVQFCIVWHVSFELGDMKSRVNVSMI